MGYLTDDVSSNPGGNNKRTLASKPPSTGTFISFLTGNNFFSNCFLTTSLFSQVKKFNVCNNQFVLHV